MKQQSIRNRRKTEANKIKKILGGILCSDNDSQMNRRECNNIIQTNLDVSQKHTECNLNNKTIKLRNIKINLGTIIGKGAYGTAYLSNIIHKNESYDIIIKAQKIINEDAKTDTEKELMILKYLSELVKKNVTPHFLYYYNEINCNNGQHAGNKYQDYILTEPEEYKINRPTNQNGIIETSSMKPIVTNGINTRPTNQNGIIKTISMKPIVINGIVKSIIMNPDGAINYNSSQNFLNITRYFVVEKASGSLSKLQYTLRLDFYSVISQIILSIYTFHQYTKCYHNDTHYNNFLYNELKQQKKTFIKYKLDNNVYRLKLSKYLIILWDYGLAYSMKNSSIFYFYNKYLINLIYEYFRILSIIYISEHYTIDQNQRQHLQKIFEILFKYNDKMKMELKNIKTHSKRINHMLKLEKEMIYALINNKLILNENISADMEAYNNIPYELDNIANYNSPIFKENPYHEPDNFNSIRPHDFVNFLESSILNSSKPFNYIATEWDI